MANELVLTVNGATRSVSVAPGTPLLYVLRNELKLRGPRLGCGIAQCGACAVLVDGKEVRSCVTPASAVSGKRVVTRPPRSVGGTEGRRPKRREKPPSLATGVD